MIQLPRLELKKSLISALFKPNQTRENFLRELERKKHWTIEETSIYLNCDLISVLEFILSGKLSAGKVGEKWHITKASLQDYCSQYHSKETEQYFIKIGEQNCLSFSDQLVTKFLKAYELGERYFEDLELIGADLSNLILSEIDLVGAILVESDFSGSNLTNSCLCDAYLMDTNLSNANFSHVGLQGTDLRGANLSNTNLSKSELQEADLTNANLTNANLSNANLFGANLTGVNLSGAILKNTIF